MPLHLIDHQKLEFKDLLLGISKRCVIAFTLQILLLLMSTTANAEQTHFKRKESDSSIQYQFGWKDIEDETQTLSFAVNKRASFNSFRHFKALSPTRMSKYVRRSLLQAINTLDPRKGKIALSPQKNGFGYKISSADQEWLDKTAEFLSERSEQSVSEFLDKEYYVKFESFGHQADQSTLGYKPDHKRFVAESSKHLTSLVNKLKEKFPSENPRQIASYLLAWLQTIPYDTIESRAQSNGAGFLPPLKLIDYNKGDCDSKVTLMASILKQFNSKLRMAIIYVPEHALIGLNIPHIADDYVINIDGLDYILSEPVGPALLKYAEISEQSKRYIESNNYKVELL